MNTYFKVPDVIMWPWEHSLESFRLVVGGRCVFDARQGPRLQEASAHSDGHVMGWEASLSCTMEEWSNDDVNHNNRIVHKSNM